MTHRSSVPPLAGAGLPLGGGSPRARVSGGLDHR